MFTFLRLKFFSAVIAIGTIFYPSAYWANSLVPNGTCELIVSTHSDIKHARMAAELAKFSIQNDKHLKILETINGEFSLSIRNISSSAAPHALRELILGGEAPKASCKSGANFVRKFDAVITAQTKKGVTQKDDEPSGVFGVRRGQCYIQLARKKTELDVARFVDAKGLGKKANLGIYRTVSGQFAVTVGKLSENQFQAQKGRAVPASSECSKGNDYDAIVRNFCDKRAVRCKAGHEVTFGNCTVDTALKSINLLTLGSSTPSPNGFVSAENAFCFVPEGLTAQDIVVTTFRGGDVKEGDYNFEGYTAKENFQISLNTKSNQVNFEWTVERPKPKPIKKGKNFFSNIRIPRDEAKTKALEWCNSYWVNSWPDHGYSHCKIDYCSAYNGSWSCEADPVK